MKYDYRDAPPDVVDLARAIAEVCERHGTILPAATIAFPLTHPAVINVTLGVRSPDQVARNVELYRRRVPEGLWDDLRERGLIRSDVPTPNGPGRSPRCP
jgi:D-threo-aldose 1-dehydrogenase